ncbi:Tetratricopeptide-like helical [Corchorus capsularis]|uniref:Tetratricopeptide-like helical n=1 Tax=Corchorus capsularis TaxID=210143 RepID=A0A1R3JAM4_COCAP|nr:Tetratricopeptide-like helical [Corchorus capsularis]
MLLKSASTPVLGSLLSSITESPNYHESSTPNRHFPSNSLFHHNNHSSRLSFHPSPGSLHVSCGSSPVSPSFAFDHFERKGFRRAQSEGNLEGLVVHDSYYSSKSNDEFHYDQKQINPARHNRLMLQTIPSFSFYNSRARCEEEDDDQSDVEEEEQVLGRSDQMPGGIGNEYYMKLLNEQEVKVGFGVGEQELMFLGADGGGISGGSSGGGGGGEFINPSGSGADGGNGVEEYYKRMVEENPGNPLFLGNYAQFLYQSKGDLEGAEEYYGRAILADPKDGGTLSQYAKLVWDLHHDHERASTYFERAVQASPQDSHVHAAYASFLWETEEDHEDECMVPSDIDSKPPRLHQGALATAS